MRFFSQLYLNWRFYVLMIAVVVLFIISSSFPWLFSIAQGVLGLVLTLTVVDVFILFLSNGEIKASRKVNAQLSLGDENPVKVHLESTYQMPVNTIIIDELPDQLQVRNNKVYYTFVPKETKEINYTIRPTNRGVYVFHNINIFISTVLHIVERRKVVPARMETQVYPSIIQMKNLELKVFSKTAIFQGIKKIRRLGNNNEFEQIKNYVQGDDYRSINWKATSRRGELMVNQYQDERAQQVYCLIDKSRSMRQPFNGLTLLDHAINATLVMSNIILKKGDKAGIMTFSDKLGSRVNAERNSAQLRRIMEVLYHQKTAFMESNMQRLYYGTRSFVKGRSLLLLFTNFDSLYSMERSISVFRRLNKNHLLVVIFFENTELNDRALQEAGSVKQIYKKTLSGKFALEKQLIVRELNKYGIQSILTRPENLSVDTINKYLELKSRGMI